MAGLPSRENELVDPRYDPFTGGKSLHGQRQWVGAPAVIGHWLPAFLIHAKF
jgi:hypothetical protein